MLNRKLYFWFCLQYVLKSGYSIGWRGFTCSRAFLLIGVPFVFLVIVLNLKVCWYRHSKKQSFPNWRKRNQAWPLISTGIWYGSFGRNPPTTPSTRYICREMFSKFSIANILHRWFRNWSTVCFNVLNKMKCSFYELGS